MAKKIQDLKFDDHNFNLHTEEGMEILEQSIARNGFGRSVLVDKDDNLISGNGITEAAIKAGKTKIKVVETTGDELVVVKRTDLDINTDKGREMALADNVTSHINLKWNEEEIRAAKEAWNLPVEDYGIELPNEVDVETFLSQDTEDVNFSTKAKIVIVLQDNENVEAIREKILAALQGIKGVKIK